MGIEAAIIGGSVIAGGAGIYGASKSAKAGEKAAKKAGETQLQATRESIEAQDKWIQQARADIAPWRTTGAEALNVLSGMVRRGPGEFEESPGYQFRLKEGEKAINRAMASRGKYFSGQAGKALTRYGQDYATQDYDNFLRRYYNRLRPWQSMAGVGQTAAGQMGDIGMTGGGNLANILMSGGRNVAQSQLAGGQARASGYTNMANILSGATTSGVENYMLSQYLKRNQPGANYMQSVGTNYPSSWQGSAGAAF